MAGYLRVPRCFQARVRYTDDIPKFDLFSNKKKIMRHYGIIPLLVIKAGVICAIPLIILHRMFVTTIDLRLYRSHRYEIPTTPEFIDLRAPRTLKLRTVEEVKPAVHLDNRYRLMRHEQMLNDEGCKTDNIGEDETAPPTNIKEAIEKLQRDPTMRVIPKLYL
ncbi:uncharacterized protein LOC144471711 [Augochlora pura]